MLLFQLTYKKGWQTAELIAVCHPQMLLRFPRSFQSENDNKRLFLASPSATTTATLWWATVFFWFGIRLLLVVAWFFALKILLFNARNL